MTRPIPDSKRHAVRLLAAQERIDDLVDEWHHSPATTGVTLQQFLGMTDEEFEVWVRDATLPERFI